MASDDLELLFTNNGRIKWGVGCFEFNEPGASTRTEINRQETTENVSSTGNLHNRHVTGEPYILIGIGRFRNWPVVRICPPTEAKIYQISRRLNQPVRMPGENKIG